MLALLTDEQQMLDEMATRLAASVGIDHPSDLDKVDRTKGWAGLAEAGLLGLRARDARGRPAASGVEVMLVARALGAALAPLPYVGSAVLAVELLSLAGAPEPWLAGLVAGETRCALLVSPDLSGLADLDDPGSGGSVLAWDADGASHALALSGSPSAPQVVRVALGDRWQPVESADLTRVVLGAGSAPAAADVEPAGRPLSAQALDRWLALALTMVSADAVGAMRHGLEQVVDYTKERVQYGVPVGSFQAVQHLCAEALVAVEGADSAVKYAAWAVDELQPAEAVLAARTAKAYCARTSRTVPETIMQVYGGIGQTWEHIAHFVNRRTLLDRQVFGDDGVQLLEIAGTRLGGR
ncbi:MAG TPA: acyl-CoA dehydrogenase family protein [Acidimicrobiales bacterium]|nr:acyl-CoA dehydrogenase family protein [Acidimicrobiales bacterium]